MVQILKSEIRKTALRKRSKLSHLEVKKLSYLINKQISSQPYFKKSKNIAYFSPFRNEPHIELPKSKNGYLPVIKNSKLHFAKITNEFVKNKYGILEPYNTDLIAPTELELVLVPLLAFNKKLDRVGYGKGYYDKYLRNLFTVNPNAQFWGIGYDFQLTEYDFRTNIDVSLHKVITDTRIYERKI